MMPPLWPAALLGPIPFATLAAAWARPPRFWARAASSHASRCSRVTLAMTRQRPVIMTWRYVTPQESKMRLEILLSSVPSYLSLR